jgi:cytidylate kinase
VTVCVVLSGPMYSGKTTTAQLLKAEFGFATVSARQVLRDLAEDSLESRADLQEFGSALEQRTNGDWLGNAVASAARAAWPSPLVVDSARNQAQVDAVRRAIEGLAHVHLTAPLAELQRRFDRQHADIDAPGSFDRAMSHPLEQAALQLNTRADLVVNTFEKRPWEVAIQITKTLEGRESL